MTNEVCSRRALRHNPSMSDLIFLLRTFGVADAGQDQLARAYDATLVGQVNDQRGLLAPGLAPQSLDVRSDIPFANVRRSRCRPGPARARVRRDACRPGE